MSKSMRLLFLDIDGVLNTHESLDPRTMCGKLHPDKVNYLNSVLEATGAKIVLTSAWRYLIHRGEMNLEGMGWLLRSHGVMANRLIGITRKDTMVERADHWVPPDQWPVVNERGQQITDYLHKEIGLVHVRSYAAIDDLDLGISEAGHPLVLTEGRAGIQPNHVAKLVKLLGRVHE